MKTTNDLSWQEWCDANEAPHFSMRWGDIMISDEQIKQILELTCYQPFEDQWYGQNDTDLGTTDELVAQIREILEAPNVKEVPTLDVSCLKAAINEVLDERDGVQKVYQVGLDSLDYYRANAQPQGDEIMFCECDTCRAKSGTPLLCSGCLKNRAAIERLTAINAELLEACQKLVAVACVVPGLVFNVGDGLEAKEAGITAIANAQQGE